VEKWDQRIDRDAEIGIIISIDTGNFGGGRKVRED
jgi:hypothetical protein